MDVIPVRFKRVAAAFDDEARARLYGGGGESSGTDHSGHQSLTDLSYLVNSFLEDDGHGGLGDDADDGKTESSPENNCSDSEIKDSLKRLFGWDEETGGGGHYEDKVKKKIHGLVVKALRDLNGHDNLSARTDFKRRLMARLRHRGLDAGLCKSKWEKNGHVPAGDYEYIDVYASGSRYFVEVSLAKEFSIARPTDCYLSVLSMFPQIFIGKQEDVKQLTRLMCNSMKKSMKKMDIFIPPWRRLAYMQAKWLSSYKRTTNETSSVAGASIHGDETSEEYEPRRKRSVGFVPNATISFLCREDFATRGGGGGGLRVGNLAAALNDNSILS
ncbi:OLC1v1020832C1 [Oldenlandia corymbosa var. corymbosa]|uniref:OLC1v1020832C1 n=1 Tax=Oldenlandia corymbosa var. corymbosa TaxID=529605 RepID=A0AAV1BWG1_OLDCO|nr:OLC1v1020832C1 [Oldenlandia corymbosa var. corymbosa]